VAKKNQKESKPRTPARFAAGAQVRVKPGITVPSFEDIPLGGWAGTLGLCGTGGGSMPPRTFSDRRGAAS